MSKRLTSKLQTIAEKEKAELADDLITANEDKAKRAAELVIANKELAFQNKEKAKRAAELVIANKELAFQNKEKAKRAAELVIANEDKAKRAAELVRANEEKAKRTAELIIANAEKAKLAVRLVIANTEKAKRAFELVIAKTEKAKREDELIIADKELVYQNEEKAKRAAELVIADINKSKRKAELVIAKIEKAKYIAKSTFDEKELDYQNEEKSKREDELVIADAEKAKRSAELVVAKIEKAKRSAELVIAKIEKTKRAAKLVILHKEIVYQKSENVKRSAELAIANIEKAKRAAEFAVANLEKSKRSAELVLIKKELFLAKEKEKLVIELTIVNKELTQQIKKRKQTELALKESEQKSKSIMENSADAIFLANQQGEYIYTNKEVSTLLGYTSEEMKSKTIAKLTDPKKHEEIFKIFNQVLIEGKIYTEIELLKKAGDFISTDLNAVLLPDGTVYGSCRDITERKKAELELVMAKEKAEESDRLKSAFLANMSHEIRTPMNGILGFAELLKRPNLSDEKQQEFLKIIGESGNRMLETINNIVDISKIEAGLMTFYFSESNINKQIEFLYEFFIPMAESKGLQLSFNNGLPSNEAIIKTDNGKVNSILTNLVKNAIKFTDEGFIEFGYEKKGEYLEFFVKDTGIGIPKDRLDAIFERFIQADIEDKRAFQGSGLGLSISKSYIEKLGGKIWVESEEGKVTVFYFTIPYNIESNDKNVIGNTVSEKAAGVEIKDLKILVVEDDETSYLFFSEAIQESNFEVIHASTGVEAIEACRNNPDLDLVLMDIRMPEMDGNEATRQIRLFNTDVIIIAQTAHAFAADIEKAMEAGCNDYISKPIKMTLLDELIKKHCNK